jgi:hypothetical protein
MPAVHRGAPEVPALGRSDRLDLRVRSAERAMEPLADYLFVAPDHGAHQRVRADVALTPLSELNRPR